MKTITPEQVKNPYRVDLAGLMAICETNYWRLRKLLLPVFPRLKANSEFLFVLPAFSKHSDRTFSLTVQECCPYTTTISFREIEGSGQGDAKCWGISPQLTVRIYHDARSAEVVAFQGQRFFLGRYPYPNPQMRQRDEKFQLNQLLADWLNHCLGHGYRLSAPELPVTE